MRLNFKFILSLLLLFFASLLIVTFAYIYRHYFYHNLPTKSIKTEDIKSVKIINVEKNHDRRQNYEKMLKQNFGNTFMGHKIGEEIRLSGVDGRKFIVFESIISGKKFKYSDVKGREQLILKDSKFKIYPENDTHNYWYFSFNERSDKPIDYKNIFTKFGCTLSHWKALRNIAKQNDKTYGIVLEDDFLVEKDFYKKLSDILKEVPSNFDILKLSLSDREQSAGMKKTRFSKFLKEIIRSYRKNGYSKKWFKLSNIGIYSELRHGSHAYLVSKEGAKKIIEYNQNHMYEDTGTDYMLWKTLPNDNIIDAYHYLAEMPIGLRMEEANKSTITVIV